ncbi:RNA-binding protein spenito isoform X2 [Folsomia candida]|uniref:RNA-binding protein spenito isoform X2 n=1 Tax=Folsomia candida TaxID=158441 RepID=UPI000B9061F5|nr:RNA-binding protein spenito isoform X2 [Folsomia candida]
MKRDRLPTSSSPPTTQSQQSMSKRSRVGRYSNNNDADSNSDGDSPLDNTTSGSVRRHHHSSSRSGRRDSSPVSSSGRRYNNEEYGAGGSSRRYKDHRSSGPLPPGVLPPPSTPSTTTYPYKVLCMSKLHQKASDDFIRDTLYREFKRYGDISVKVVNEPDERVAYVYFRSAEDAREVKHSKTAIYIYDRAVKVEAAYESAPGGSGGGGGGGGMAPSYGSKPHHQQQHHHHEYDKYGGGGGGSGSRRSPPTYHDTRRDDRGGGGGGGYDRYNDGRMPPQQMHHYNNDRGYNGRGGGGGGGGGDYRQQQHHQPYGRYPPGPQSHHHSGPPPPMHHHHQPMSHSGGPPPLGPPRGHHHQPPPPMHMDHSSSSMGPPPHLGGGPGGGPGGPSRYENKKDKFPNYLQHVNPEEDPLATRTLFAGNLEVNITDEELRRIFGRYGIVEDIDIKRPPPGTGNAYAFVRFVNLDMSSRAKAELSGQYIGKFQCKIGYGKMNPTTKIWVGGLGPWTTLPMLEREFDRFGSIKKIDWANGEIVAYITYETIDAAQAAVKDMRGYPLGGPDKKLRTDFADAGAPLVGQGPGGSNFGGGYGDGGGNGDFEYGNKFGNGNGGGSGRRDDDKTASPHSSNELASPGGVSDDGESGSLSSARTIAEIGSRAPLAWTGALILKNSSFPTRFFLTDGDLDGIESLMKDEDGKFQLKITQRLKLDKAKLDDVQKRITTSPSHGIFLSLPSTTPTTNSNLSSPNNNDNNGEGVAAQSRPLRNLVSYLKQKEAAGVISLVNPKDKTITGVLYVFPPCAFSWGLLKRGVSGLQGSGEEGGGDYLVVVVIKGATA